jgi:signal transduction histidine kinase
MLLGPRGQALPPEQRRLIELANKSCQRALDLTHELSDLARLTAGTAALNAGPTDVGRLLVDAAAGARGQVTDVTIDCDTPTSAFPITGDAERLRHALESLVMAVARETPEGATVLVRCSQTSASSAPSAGPMIVVTVAPVAAAASEDTAAVDLTMTASGHDEGDFDQFRGGLGLRLPIAALVIGELGGTICVEPGTTPPGLVIRLPPAAS